MLFIVCALISEAESIISYFKLKKNGGAKLFSIYSSDHTYLIISGIGKLNAAAAAAYLYHYVGEIEDQIWLNIGIAGHPYYQIGTGYLALKICDQQINKHYYPQWIFKTSFSKSTLTTVDIIETCYRNETLYDMEAFGFYSMACRFSTLEKIHCYKIVSDNKTMPAAQFSSQQVSLLVSQNISEISSICENLISIANEVSPIDLEFFFNRWHFTETQKIQLKSLLRKCRVFQPIDLFPGNSLEVLKKTSDVIEYLKNKINQQPLVF